MRSCRYAAPLYVDMNKTTITREQGEDGNEPQEEREEEEFPKVFIGEVRDFVMCTCSNILANAEP